MTTYNENSIKKLDPLSFTRLRPDTYCGSTANSTQLVTEIVSNSVDEHLIGNCDEIFIEINNNNSITVADNGQGIIPNVIKDNGKSVLEMVYGEINASGKFDKSDSAVYKVSTGAFGIGASLTCFLSHRLIATTKRNGSFETVFFNEGVFEKREQGKCNKNEHGVSVTFFPSEEFFTDAHPDKNKLKENLENIACVCPKLKFYFNGELIHHPNGIKDLVVKNISKELFSNIFYFDTEKDNQKITLSFGYSTSSDTKIIAFCNYGIIEAGIPISTVKGCITKTLNKWGQDNKVLKKNDNLSGSSLQEGLVIVFNLVSQNIRYDSQTKVRCSSTEDNPFINEVLSKNLEKWLDNNPQDGRAIIEKALLSRRAAEAAKKARDAVKNGKKKMKIANMPSKLADCNSRNRSECDLYLTEGDSASGGAKLIRNSATQGVMGLKGKILNVLTSKPEQILKNAEICDIIKALGLDYSYESKKVNVEYNEKKLRYGKIIIAADRDPDGGHICALLLTLFWTLIPELILNGKVYIAKPPLYKAEWGQDKFQYIQDKKALEEFKKKNKKFTLTYFKGLGEASPEELGQMIMNPQTRELELVCIENVKEAEKTLNDLMGRDTKAKKDFVFGVE